MYCIYPGQGAHACENGELQRRDSTPFSRTTLFRKATTKSSEVVSVNEWCQQLSDIHVTHYCSASRIVFRLLYVIHATVSAF